MKFDALDEALVVSKLADQALRQPTREGEKEAMQLLADELHTLTPDQLRAVKIQMDLQKSHSEHFLNSINDQIAHLMQPSKFHPLQTLPVLQAERDGVLNKAEHQPILSFVTRRDQIYGATFREADGKAIYISDLHEAKAKPAP